MVENEANTKSDEVFQDKKNKNQMKDYFCPLCSEKLFKGKVANFKMVCPHCGKLVNSADISSSEIPEASTLP